MPCLRHRSLADIPAACSFKTLMICSSVNLLLRIVRLLSGEQKPNLKSGAFQGSRSQAFSDIGHRKADDPRRSLLGHFFRIVAQLEPIFFVMENVRGLGYA